MPKLYLSSFIVHYSLFIALTFLLISCSSSTSPKTGALTGRVIMVNDTGDSSLDPIDFSGVTVALYKLTVLDTTIVRINKEYPQVGVQISQETEFDHRFENPIQIVATSEDGSFSMDGLKAGKYNLVVYLQGWSLYYMYNIVINEGSNSIPSEDQINLYPAREIPSVVQTSYLFDDNHTYIFHNDTTVLSNISFVGSALLLIAPSKRVDFHGNVSRIDNSRFMKITSLANAYDTSCCDSIQGFTKLSFSTASNLHLSRAIINRSIDGMTIETESAQLERSIIKDNAYGLTINSNPSFIKECIISDNSVKGIVAFNSIELDGNIIYKNRDACFLSETTSEIKKNYVVSNYIGLRPFYGDNYIHNNCFDQNSNAISPCASNPSIMKNNFYDNARDIELNNYYVQADYDYCNPEVEFNNFFGNGWYVYLRGNNSVYGDGGVYGPGVNSNQIYPNNYLNSQDLISHVYDASCPQVTDVPFFVTFSPRRYSRVMDAGI